MRGGKTNRLPSGRAGRAERSPRGGPLLGDLLRLPGGRCDDRRGKMVFGGRPRCCCARRRRSRRRAPTRGVFAPRRATTRVVRFTIGPRGDRQFLGLQPCPATPIFGRAAAYWLPQATGRTGRPRVIRSRLLDAPGKGSSRRNLVPARVRYHEARNVDAARHATRGCWGGAAPTAGRPRRAARRSGGRASGPSVPAGRRPRLGLPAAAGAPAARPWPQRKPPVVRPRAPRAAAHTRIFRRGG